jgi:hypothetical protein
MSASVEASCLIRRVVGPCAPGTKVATLIDQAARRLGWSRSRAFDVWYEKSRRIDAEEMDALRRAAGSRAGALEDAGRREYADLVHYLLAVTLAAREDMDRS